MKRLLYSFLTIALIVAAAFAWQIKNASQVRAANLFTESWADCTTAWGQTGGGNCTVAGGVVTMTGTHSQIDTNSSFDLATSPTVRVMFNDVTYGGSGNFEFGFGASSYPIFLNSGSNYYYRDISGATHDTGVALGGTHDFVIDFTSTGNVAKIDGVQVYSDASTASGSKKLRIYAQTDSQFQVASITIDNGIDPPAATTKALFFTD